MNEYQDSAQRLELYGYRQKDQHRPSQRHGHSSSMSQGPLPPQIQIPLPPMGDVWLDEDGDEDDGDEDAHYDIMKRLKWHSRKESTVTTVTSYSNDSSTLASPLSSTVSMNYQGSNYGQNSYVSAYASNTTNSTNNTNNTAQAPQLASRSSSLSLGGFKKFSSRSPSSGSGGIVSPNEVTGYGYTNTASNSNNSAKKSASNNKLKKFFSPISSSSSSSYPVIDKTMISAPSNFVHTAHLDSSSLGSETVARESNNVAADAVAINGSASIGMGYAQKPFGGFPTHRPKVSISSSYRSHRKTSTSGSTATFSSSSGSGFASGSICTSASSASAASHLRDNSTASASSMSQYMTSSSIVTSTKTSPSLGSAAEEAESEETEAAVEAAEASQFPHSTSSNTVTMSDDMKPKLKPQPQPTIGAKASVESFTSWGTPNPDFVEQQKWLLNNVLGSDHSIHAFVNGDHSPTQFAQAHGGSTQTHNANTNSAYSTTESVLLPASTSFNSMKSVSTIQTARSNSNIMNMATLERRSVLLP